MLIGLLSTGDELIHGDTLNTNVHALAQTLSASGLPLGLQVTCSDKETELLESLTFLANKHDTIILLGGLGPTSDDRTRFALAHFLGIPLTSFKEAVEHVTTALKRTRPLNAGDQQQTLFPVDSVLLPNPYGTAMGCYFVWQGKRFILLPGPPKECLPMFEQFVLPMLEQEGQRSRKIILRWRLFGLPESQMANQLDTALKDVECQTGYRLDLPYVEFKLRCYPEQVAKIESIIMPILEPLMIATVAEKASTRFARALADWKVPVVIEDEVTGGLLQTLIQQPSNHEFLRFSPFPEHAPTRFQIHLKGLTDYWQQTVETQTSLEIYINDSQKGMEDSPICESHQLAYRNEKVLYYAAEWLSYRLYQRLNQRLSACISPKTAS
ncbi:MAG: competence/damage-inducible protein A [Legionella sp.]|nr:competence/damage-inducible protein A [Legionella sp.]